MIVLRVSGPGITQGMDEIRAQAPCYNCHMYDELQYDEPVYQRQVGPTSLQTLYIIGEIARCLEMCLKSNLGVQL